jgi:hypothetical protein
MVSFGFVNCRKNFTFGFRCSLHIIVKENYYFYLTNKNSFLKKCQPFLYLIKSNVSLISFRLFSLIGCRHKRTMPNKRRKTGTGTMRILNVKATLGGCVQHAFKHSR